MRDVNISVKPVPFKEKLVILPGGGRNNFFCILLYLLLFK